MPAQTWDGNYVGVYHFNDSSYASGSTIQDSTALAGAMNVNAGTMTSSPACTSDVSSARCRPAVPLATATAYDRPVTAASSRWARTRLSPS